MNVTALRHPWRKPLLALILVTVWLVTMAGLLMPSVLRSGDAAFYLQLVVKEVSQLVLWVAAWAWVNQTRQGRTQLDTHTSLAFTAGLFDNAVPSFALPWAFFAMGWTWPAGLYDIIRAVLIALLGLLHLRLACNGLTPRRLALWLLASTLAISLVAANSWIKQNNSEALDRLGYEPNIYPAWWVKKPQHGIDDGLKAMWERDWDKGER